MKNPLRPKRTILRSVIDFFLKSSIISFIFGMTESFYKKISQSIFASVFTSYERIVKWFESSAIVRFFKPQLADSPVSTISYKISAKYESSLCFMVVDKIKWAIITCQLNVLAVFGITFGFTSSLILILKNFAFKIQKISLSELLDLANPLMASLCFIIVSILLLFSKKPLIRVINESRIFNYILFDLLLIRKIPYYDYEQHTGMSGGVSALLGIVLGTLSFIIAPSQIALFLGIAILALIILHSPEAGALAIFLLLPFLPTMSLVFAVCTVTLSFFIKCCRRKRIFKLEAIDIAVIIFLLFIISGGLVSVDIPSSTPKMLVFLCFALMYFIVKNLIRTERLLTSCAKCICISSIIVSAIGVIQYYIGDVSQTWQDTQMFSSIPGRAVSTFGNPNVLSEYLILIMPVIFAMLISAKTVSDKFLFFSSFVLSSYCLIFTWSRGAWLGFACVAILFILLKSHRFLAGILISSPFILLVISFMLNSNIVSRILSIGNVSDSSTLYRVNIWKGTFDMLGDTFFYGIGIGTEAFSKVFPHYALAGTEVAPHTHSLYLQIISEMGIFALISFIVIILAYVGNVFGSMSSATRPGVRTVYIGFLCGILAFLIQGATDYVWYNYRIYLMFWLMLGLGMAMIKVCTENERKRFMY